MILDDLVVAVLAIGCAIGAFVGLRRRRGRPRLWYAAQLALGAGLGAWLLGLDDAWGVILGIAAGGYWKTLAEVVMTRIRAWSSTRKEKDKE